MGMERGLIRRDDAFFLFYQAFLNLLSACLILSSSDIKSDMCQYYQRITIY